MKNLYDILEIPPDADLHKIRLAYISHLEQIDHSEAKCVGSEAAVRLHAVKEAYGILSSDVRRKRYDSKLRQHAALPLAPVQPEKTSWGFAAILVMLLTGGSFHYYHQKAEDHARGELNAARAEANARRAQSAFVEERSVIDMDVRALVNSAEFPPSAAHR